MHKDSENIRLCLLVFLATLSLEMFNSAKYNYTNIELAHSFYENGNATMIDKDNTTIRIFDGHIVAISYPIHIRSHVWTVTTIA